MQVKILVKGRSFQKGSKIGHKPSLLNFFNCLFLHFCFKVFNVSSMLQLALSSRSPQSCD